jgi:hypothetical protein
VRAPLKATDVALDVAAAPLTHDEESVLRDAAASVVGYSVITLGMDDVVREVEFVATATLEAVRRERAAAWLRLHSQLSLVGSR